MGNINLLLLTPSHHQYLFLVLTNLTKLDSTFLFLHYYFHHIHLDSSHCGITENEAVNKNAKEARIQLGNIPHNTLRK